jgi:hypothetical protein
MDVWFESVPWLYQPDKKSIAVEGGRLRGKQVSRLVWASRRVAARARTADPRSSGSGSRCRFQLLDLGELVRCHLHHQIEDRLLFHFANLYELHARQPNRWENSWHPPLVAGAMTG